MSALSEVQVDFKDASTVRPDPSGEGKQQQVVEICHVVDAGTSVLLSAQVHGDFHAETAMARSHHLLAGIWSSQTAVF